MGSTLMYSPSKPNFGRRKICSSKIKIPGWGGLSNL